MFINKDKAKERYKICLACDNLRPLIKTCKICNCIMPLKTKLISSECPIGKWKSPINSWSK